MSARLKSNFSKPEIFRLCLLASIILLILSCNQSQQTNPAENNVTPRIITLSPHLGELAEAAGAVNNLVGIVSYTKLQSNKKIAEVGDAFKLDYERILSLKPDYILSWKDGTPLMVTQKLQALGLNVVKTEINSLNDIPITISQIAKLAHTETQAKANIDRFTSTLSKLKRNSPNQTVFIETFHQPLYTVSGKHWLSEAVAICGYQNIFTDMQPLSASVSLEAVINANPDMILNISNNNDSQWSKWKNVNAVKNNRILTISPDLMSHPNMRLLEGIEKLCEF